MANLKEVRTRIASVKSTKQITSAMKMVAASRLRKAQNAILTLRPYAAKLQEIMQDVGNSLEAPGENVFTTTREPNKVLIVAVTSNRGLCGGFNINVVKQVAELLDSELATQYKSGQVDLFCIGKKGADLLKSKSYPVKEVETEIFNNLTFEFVAPIAEKLMGAYLAGDYDRILLVYNQFKNAAVQELQTEQFLPVSDKEKPLSTEEPTHQIDYIFEPGKQEILTELIPKTLRIQLYKALLDSVASEHGARMTAMHKATDNATDLIKELNLSYNKARQASITNEILEIVSGAEALKG